MPQLESFIKTSHRPEINGGRLDKQHQSKFLLDYSKIIDAPVIAVNTIAFGPKQDKVLLNLEHAIKNDGKTLIFYYEDLHSKWTFFQTNHESYFVYRKNEEEQYRIRPSNLYIRGCQVDSDDIYWTWLGEFYNFADNWPGPVLCAPEKQNNNESKLYQLNNSLKNASHRSKNISIGHSFVLKGKNALNKFSKSK